MLASNVLKAINTAFTINLMSVFWDCLQLAVTEAGHTIIPPLLILNNPVLDTSSIKPTNSTITAMTGIMDTTTPSYGRKFDTAMNTRTIEMVGIATSFITVCISLIIFHSFPTLRSRRILIHRNLFYALLMEVTVRMVLYTQQSYSFYDSEQSSENEPRGIEYFPYVCEGVYVLLEYSRLVVYAWMFIEGIFLHSLVSANSLRSEIPIIYFYLCGWGVPAIIIGIWATVVGKHYANEPVYTCWYGYNYLPTYYIIQGPILAIVAINMVFLGFIMSVIIMKLRRSHDTELRKLQKAIRAAIILMPLLGIVNVFHLFDYPLDGSSIGFAVWAYFTHFFRSFQGVFISSIYCFTNEEVGRAVTKSFERRTWCRYEWMERPQNTRQTTQPRPIPEPVIVAIPAPDGDIELAPIEIRTWDEPEPSHVVVDLEAGPIEVGAMSDAAMNRRLRGPSGRGRSRSLSAHMIPELETVNFRTVTEEPGVTEIYTDRCQWERQPQQDTCAQRRQHVTEEPRIGEIHMRCPVWERQPQPTTSGQRRPHMRTLSVHLPADDRPGSEIEIHIKRVSSADTACGIGNEEVITVRRSSADPALQSDRENFDRGSHATSRRASAETACMYTNRKASSGSAEYQPACVYHDPIFRTTSSTSSSDIPSIPPPPMVSDLDFMESSSNSETASVCCTCVPRRRSSSVPDKRGYRDVSIKKGTEYNPHLIHRNALKTQPACPLHFPQNQTKGKRDFMKPRRSTAEVPPRVNRWDTCFVPDFQEQPYTHTAHTIPRRGRRDVFVRPGLVTGQKQTRLTKSLNCL